MNWRDLKNLSNEELNDLAFDTLESSEIENEEHLPLKAMPHLRLIYYEVDGVLYDTTLFEVIDAERLYLYPLKRVFKCLIEPINSTQAILVPLGT